jgi:hypothetical protein
MIPLKVTPLRLTSMLVLTGVIALSIVGCRSHGVAALHSGMNEKEVIAALGEPNCSDITRDSFPQHRTGLAYMQDTNTFQVIELDERGVIYGRTVLAFKGPESAKEACSSAAFGSVSREMSTTKLFSLFLGVRGMEDFEVREHYAY